MNRVVESVRLAYQDHRSDKVYVIELIEVDGKGFIVTAYNGRRGANLTKQPKITTPVAYGAAKRKFDQLEAKKCSPGYKTPYHVVERKGPSTTQARTAESFRSPRQEEPTPSIVQPDRLDMLEI